MLKLWYCNFSIEYLLNSVEEGNKRRVQLNADNVIVFVDSLEEDSQLLRLEEELQQIRDELQEAQKHSSVSPNTKLLHKMSHSQTHPDECSAAKTFGKKVSV